MRILLCSASLLLVFLVSACAIPVYSIPRDERSTGEIMDDTIIRSDIKSAIMTKDASQGFAANIFSYQGHVFVVGAVSKSFRNFVLETAHDTKGVHAVTAVWFDPSVKNDESLGLKVRTALIEDSKLSSTQIDLEAYAGEVILLGMVRSTADVNEAIATAHKVQGVSKVRSYLIPSR